MATGSISSQLDAYHLAMAEEQRRRGIARFEKFKSELTQEQMEKMEAVIAGLGHDLGQFVEKLTITRGQHRTADNLIRTIDNLKKEFEIKV